MIKLLYSNTESIVKLVWDDSTQLGIGMATADHPKFGHQIYVVAQYLPRGNTIGEHTQRVHSLKDNK